MAGGCCRVAVNRLSSCSGICRTPHGISVGLYPLLSLSRKVACGLTSSAGPRWCGPCVLRWAALRNLSLRGLRSCLWVHICVFALLRTAVHLCVSVHNKRSLSIRSALHILGVLVGSRGSCSVLPLRVATLPSAGRTTITVVDSNTWKTHRNFYSSSRIVGFIKSMMMYGAKGRLTGEKQIVALGEKIEV
jgi:hypothetical protein